MLRPVNRGNGVWGMVDDGGQMHAIPDDLATEFFQSGQAERPASGLGAPPALGGSGGGTGTPSPVGPPRDNLNPWAPAIRKAVDIPDPAPPQPVAPVQRQPNLQRVPPRRVEQPQERLTKTITTKGGMRPDTMSTSGITPDQQAGLIQREFQLRDKQLEYAHNQYESENKRLLLENVKADIGLNETKKQIEEQQRTEALRKQRAKIEKSRLGNVIDAVDKREVESFADREGFGTVLMGALAAGAGQWASIMGGGPNIAADMFNNAVRRDVDLQLKQKDEEKNTAMLELEQFLRDNDFTATEQREILEGLRQRQGVAELRKMSAEKDFAQLRPLFEKTMLDIEAQSNDKLLPYLQAVENKVNLKYQPGGTSTVMTDKAKQDLGEWKARGELAKAKTAAGEGVGVQPGEVSIGGQIVGKVPDEKLARDLTQQSSLLAGMKSLLGQMKDLQRNASVLNNEQRGLYSQLRNEVAMDFAKAKSFRLGTEQDFEHVTEIVSKDIDTVTNQDLAKLENLDRNISRDFERELETWQLDTTPLRQMGTEISTQLDE